jgi:D-sedoheptulose 7-phosphate isomerase
MADIDHINKRFAEALLGISKSAELLPARLAQACDIIVASYQAGGGMFVFGNGGSAADAQHIACEMVGRFLQNRRAYKAQALSTDTSIMTALANDFGFETIFARQLEANARKGDVAIALTTSGNSPNVLAALRQARELGMKTIVFTGAGGGACKPLADVLLDVPATACPRVQEAHVVMYHILCELVEQTMVELSGQDKAGR